MKKSVRRKKFFLMLSAFSLAGSAIGGVFSSLIAEEYKPSATADGLLAGFIIAAVIGFLETAVFDRMRRSTMFPMVLVKTMAYSLVVVSGYLLADAVVFGMQVLLYDIRLYMVRVFLFSMVSVFLFVMLLNINRLLGQRALLRLFFGKYHRPIIEKRIMMFLDLSSSTRLAEDLGDLTFHSFLNDFFFDATEPILERGGEIYKYVGDEVIITWPMEKGLKDGNCLACVFDIRDDIESARERYIARYGCVPAFRAGIHCGNTVVGEMGDYKREVAFLGDVMNTTSRIQAECRPRMKDLIISGDLLKELPAGALDTYRLVALGSIELRGKSSGIELYSVGQ